MFYHVKELQFNARVSKPDPQFATLLLEQFGGANGELAAALRYFAQAFGAKKPYPDKYDLLMDIATEEFSHLEIVGATIQMLLTGINGDLKNAAEVGRWSRSGDAYNMNTGILFPRGIVWAGLYLIGTILMIQSTLFHGQYKWGRYGRKPTIYRECRCMTGYG